LFSSALGCSTLIRSCAAQVLDLGDVGLVDLLDASVNVFPGFHRVGSADDLVLAGLVGVPITDLKLHRQDAERGRWRRL
jgi:hypothetical protein